LDAVLGLRTDVAAAGLPLAIEGVESARISRERLLDQLDDHLIPRLRELTAPALVVLAGPTGSGKSTLLNSLVGEEVSPAGVLRPTTRQAVLVHHPADADVLANHPLMTVFDVRAHDQVPRGIVLVDAPDMDSVEEENRRMSHRLLESADLWLFLTTANRYGDAIPWDNLTNATARGASVALILNRVEPGTAGLVRTDLTGRLVDCGMSDVPVFLIPEAGSTEGLLIGPAIDAIARWLRIVAGPDRAKAIVARTLRGSLGALLGWVDDLAVAIQKQVDARDTLRTTISDAVAGARTLAAETTSSSALADGGVQARWAAVTSPGALLAVKETRGRLKAPRLRPQRREDDQRLFVGELDRAVQVGVQTVGISAEQAIRAALNRQDAPTGSNSVLGEVDRGEEDARRRKDARLLAGGWLDEIGASVAAARDDSAAADRLEDLALAVGADTVSAVVATAALGLGAAQDFLARYTGQRGMDIVEPARVRLAQLFDEQVDREVTAYTGIVDGAGLADDAAAGLHLRLAVLKGLI